MPRHGALFIRRLLIKRREDSVLTRLAFEIRGTWHSRDPPRSAYRDSHRDATRCLFAPDRRGLKRLFLVNTGF